MPPYEYYSRKTVEAKETEFFDVSRAEAPKKEIETNLKKDHRVIEDFAVDKLMVYLPFEEAHSDDGSTPKQLEDQKRVLDEGVLAIKVGDEAEEYYRVAECLDNITTAGAVSVGTGTSVTEGYQLAGVSAGDGEKGLPVEISIPAETNFTVTLETDTAPTKINVCVILSGSH